MSDVAAAAPPRKVIGSKRSPQAVKPEPPSALDVAQDVPPLDLAKTAANKPKSRVRKSGNSRRKTVVEAINSAASVIVDNVSGASSAGAGAGAGAGSASADTNDCQTTNNNSNALLFVDVNDITLDWGASGDTSADEYVRWREKLQFLLANMRYSDWVNRKKPLVSTKPAASRSRSKKKVLDNKASIAAQAERLRTERTPEEFATLNNAWLVDFGFDGAISAAELTPEVVNDNNSNAYAVYVAALASGVTPRGIASGRKEELKRLQLTEPIVYVGKAHLYMNLPASIWTRTLVDAKYVEIKGEEASTTDVADATQVAPA